jgi:hypothetical protein
MVSGQPNKRGYKGVESEMPKRSKLPEEHQALDYDQMEISMTEGRC